MNARVGAGDEQSHGLLLPHGQRLKQFAVFGVYLAVKSSDAGENFFHGACSKLPGTNWAAAVVVKSVKWATPHSGVRSTRAG
jgi:hypothetical protein